MASVFSCEFEVHGKVQGVYFRRHAEKKAKSLGLRGWCMNTNNGTVKGYIEGPRIEIKLMKEWLSTTGSPTSSIQKAEFTRNEEKRDYGFRNFEIRPDAPNFKNRKASYKCSRVDKMENDKPKTATDFRRD